MLSARNASLPQSLTAFPASPWLWHPPDPQHGQGHSTHHLAEPPSPPPPCLLVRLSSATSLWVPVGRWRGTNLWHLLACNTVLGNHPTLPVLELSTCHSKYCFIFLEGWGASGWVLENDRGRMRETQYLVSAGQFTSSKVVRSKKVQIKKKKKIPRLSIKKLLEKRCSVFLLSNRL